MTPKEHDSLKALERGQWQPWHIAVKVLAKYGSKSIRTQQKPIGRWL